MKSVSTFCLTPASGVVRIMAVGITEEELAMKVTEKGQVTIPIGIRRKMGFLANTDVEFAVSGKNVVLRKSAKMRRRGSKLIATMRGTASKRLSTDQIMALTRGD
jgi:AbrB family looped-hinge helix DNA binding protein